MRCAVSLNTLACEGSAQHECFSCGEAACRADSRIAVTYYRWNLVRICNDCIEERQDDIRDGKIRFLTTRS